MGIRVRPANRQYVAMSEEEVFAFLRQLRVIFVATVKPNGHPHVVPVWFTVIGKKLYFRTQDYKVKVKNIARNPWVACSAEAGDKYVSLRGVMIEGIARIVEDEEESRRVQQEIIARTRDLRWRAEDMPRDWVEARMREHYVVVEITPHKISSWDNSKLRVAAHPDTIAPKSDIE
jgi:PPOX class probable F420-dependent enzyme